MLYFEMARILNTGVLDDLSIWSEANSSKDLQLAPVWLHETPWPRCSM